MDGSGLGKNGNGWTLSHVGTATVYVFGISIARFLWHFAGGKPSVLHALN